MLSITGFLSGLWLKLSAVPGTSKVTLAEMNCSNRRTRLSKWDTLSAKAQQLTQTIVTQLARLC